MGLNIGIKVKEQIEGYGYEGYNPKGNIKEIEERFFDFLHSKFPLGGFGRGGVSYSERDKEYDFDVRMFSYSQEFYKKYPNADMHLTITEFIYGEFSHIEGIELRTYWFG